MKNFILSLSLCLLALTACEKKSESSNTQKVTYQGDPVINDWIVFWLPANPQILNPIIATDAYSSAVTGYVFDTLLAFDPDTGEAIGRLAESWSVSEDGLSYTFNLRPGLRFHDGKALTAEDVKFSFDLLKNPEIQAPARQSYFQNLESTEVLSTTSVQIRMSTPYYRNLIMLGLNEIMPKHIYAVGDFNTHANNRSPVGSGPYKFAKWDAGRSIELLPNEDWWGRKTDYWEDRFNFKKVLFRVITEDNVAAMALKKGEIDLLEPTPQQYVKDFAGEDVTKNFHRLKYTTDDGNGFRFIGWNLKRPLFQSKEVRRALAHAMPREELNDRMYEGLLNMSVGPFPQGSSKLDSSVKPISYDLEEAQKLLTAEGWKDTNGNGILDKAGQEFVFEILFTAQSPEVERIALVFQQALKQIGVQMNIKTLEWTVYLKQVMEGNFEAMMMAWGSSLDSDPFQIWHSSQAAGGGSNRVSYNNKRVDELLEKARITLDREERNKLYQEFSKIVADEAPYLFIFERPSLAMVSKRFEGVLPVGMLGMDTARFFTPPGQEKYKSQ